MSLVNNCFASDARGMLPRFPVLFGPANLGNCRVLLDGDRVVSHVVYLPRQAVLGGPVVAAACVGAVCTDEAYRGRGLASQVLDDCEARMRRQGLDVIYISGDRDLYRRWGARKVGRHLLFKVTPAIAERLVSPALALADAGPDDLPVLAALYEAKPVRFSRGHGDWEAWFRCGHCEGRTARATIGRAEGRPVAYVAHTPFPPDDGEPTALEWGGAPSRVAALLAALAARAGPSGLCLTLEESEDAELAHLLKRAGARPEPGDTCRTVRALRPAALFDKARPCLPESAQDIRVDETASGAHFRLGRQGLHVEAGELPGLFFGDPEGRIDALLAPAGRLGSALLEAFPIPLPRYGYNFT